MDIPARRLRGVAALLVVAYVHRRAIVAPVFTRQGIGARADAARADMGAVSAMTASAQAARDARRPVAVREAAAVATA